MKAVCFGEIMLRLSPIGYKRFLQADSFDAIYGGGEANVSLSLANYGVDSVYVTKLPQNDVAQSAINSLRAFGVDTTKIVRGGKRIGIYYCEKGASMRPSKVIYDRAASAIAEAKRADFNWSEILNGVDWFHFTGITPALGGELPEICMDALTECKKRGITTSCDLNYRKNLWSCEEAGRIMGPLMEKVDLCIANEEDADKVFGIRADNTDTDRGIVDTESYKQVAKKLSDRFGCKYVAITLRTSISANDNRWQAMLYEKSSESYNFSREYNIHIVDRVGGGDSFGGGLIYSLLSGKSSKDALEFAVAASALKHTIEGDVNLVSAQEVEALIKGGTSGRVQR